MSLWTGKPLWIVVAVILVGGDVRAQSPQGPGTLTFSSDAPQQGERVQAAYDASDLLRDAEDVVLRARLRTPDDGVYGEGTDTRTLARLRRDADGVYRGEFVYPDSVVFALVAVSTPNGAAVDSNLRQGWPLMAYDAGGRPLAEALDQQLQDLTGRDFRTGVRVAQQRAAEYPDDPQGWYLLSFFEDASSGAQTDSTKEAERAERAERVRSFDRAFTAAAEPDLDAVAGLIWLAGTQGEIAERWTDWLIARAPTHPTAVQFRVYRALQETWGRPDSTLAALNRIWDEAGPAHNVLLDYGFRKALEAGDSEEALRWADRKIRAQPWTAASVDVSLVSTPATRAEGVRRLHDDVEHASASPDDERDLFATVEAHHAAQRADVAQLQASLGAALLTSGDSADALAPLQAAASEIWDADLFMGLASARLSAGDSLGAAHAFARVAVDPGAADADSAWALGQSLVETSEWSEAILEAEGQQLAWTLRSADSATLPEGAVVLDGNGERVDVRDALSGEGPVIAVLYSQYCGYCVAATPEIEALREQLASSNARVVIVTAEPPGTDSEAFFDEHGYSGLVYHDVDREAALAFGSAGVPAYFVLDGRGAVRFQFTSLAEIPRQVAALATETAQQAQSGSSR